MEFVAILPALHVGHGRGAAVGDIIARILDFTGRQVRKNIILMMPDCRWRFWGVQHSPDTSSFGSGTRSISEDAYKGEYIYDLAGDHRPGGGPFPFFALEESLGFFQTYAAGRILEGIKKTLQILALHMMSGFQRRVSTIGI